MIQISGLSKSFGERELFSDVTFSVNRNERIGFVGRNGSGKSTLFKIILNLSEYDSGDVIIPKEYKIGYLEQHIEFTKDNIVDECMQVLPEDEKFNQFKAEKILFGLGFTDDDLQKNPSTFSGGYQIRINLVKVLLKEPNLLLLDEPTNYLDIISMRWLKSFLVKYPGEIILISHDRNFMNDVSTHTMGLHRGKILKTKGNTKKYYEIITENEVIYENTRINQEKKKKEIETFVNKFRAKARQAGMAQSRAKMLEKMEINDQLSYVSDLNFKFNFDECPAKTLLNCDSLKFGYTEELLIENLKFSIQKNDKIGIIGKNGKGKSTLLNLIAGILPHSESFNEHSSLKIGHFGQTNIERLHLENTIEQEIQSENLDLTNTQVRNICGTMMFPGDDAKKKIEILSGGERSRVLLGKILAKKTNLLLLDEPTNHLDQESIEALLEQLKSYKGAVVIITHNEGLLSSLVDKLIIFKRNNCETFLGNYEDFLNKIGWEEEETSLIKSKVKLSKKEYKKLRQNIIHERSKVLSPLKKKIESLESKIIDYETTINESNNKLIVASENDDSKLLTEASKSLSDAEKNIELCFYELEKESDKLTEKESYFNTQLDELR